MKKIFKILSVFIIVICGFFVIKVLADNKPEVKEYIQTGYYSAVLYSDDKLYMWGTSSSSELQFVNTTVEGVTDIFRLDEGNLGIIDNENNLKVMYVDYYYINEEEGYKTEIITTDTLKSNIKKIDYNHLLTEDNKLYYYYFHSWGDENYNETLIMNDVKDWSYNSDNGSYLLLDNDDKLYAYGRNIFGKKINDGEDITLSPIPIAENVKEFSCNVYGDRYSLYGNFYLTKDNKLYIMSNQLPYPKLLKENVDKFLYDNFYISDGGTYKIDYRIEDDSINIRTDEFMFDEELLETTNSYYSYYDEKFFLTENGNLYDYEYNKISSDVKQIYSNRYSSNMTYVVKNNGDLLMLNYVEYYNLDSHRYVSKIVESNLLTDVKEVYDESTFIMEDEIIYVKGSGVYDIANFNGGLNVNYKNFVVIEGLPNVNENIVLSHINLNYNNKIEYVSGDTTDFYVELYPYNATDKDVIWSSSDESVAKVSQDGTLSFLNAGKATIKVESKSLDISDEVEIIVHPKNSGIEILGDKEITMDKSEEKLLKVKITPEGVLPQKIKWTSDAGEDKYGDDIIRFYGINEEYNYCYDDICPKSYDEIGFSVSQSGTYTITATTEDGLYSDSIKVNVVQGITSFGINPDYNNYLGGTLYIYMKESVYMDLNVKIYPEDATDKEIEYSSSDESIATVDSTGRVTAKKAGKVTITFKAKNYDVERSINVLIFDKTVDTKLGDVDGDGIVDILDVVKLRRHVAGVEALQ